MLSAVPAHEPAAASPSLGTRRSVIIARNIAHNWRCKFRLALGEREIPDESQAADPLEQTLDYIDRVYRDYVFYGNLGREHIEGHRILELGSEGNFGVALWFLAAGAAQVVALCSSTVTRETERSAGIYRAIRKRLGSVETRNFDAAVDLTHGIHINPERLQPIEGVAAEEASRVLAPGSFSLIVSRAVLEEVYEIDAAFAAMDRLLERGGRMLHKIDLSDYGMFSNHGMHPLEFLTIPEPVYTMMSEYSGQPNRWRIDYYRRKMRELGYFAGLLVTAVVGEPGEVLPHQPSVEQGTDYGERSLELVRGIRPRLVRPFRDVPDEDLLVTGVFLVARKPE